MNHNIHPTLVDRDSDIEVMLVGAGGTGSHVLGGLATIHHAMVELGYPFGLNVTVVDPDEVSPSNIGRQKFAPSDIGLPKASVLVNRCNLTMRTNWSAAVAKITDKTDINGVDIIIGCVDNRKGRAAIVNAASRCRGHVYYLDVGNREHDGQVVLGEIHPKRMDDEISAIRLPHVGDLYPEIIDASLDDADETPSCSLAEALEKQSLFVNSTMANAAMNILWNLLRYGQISHHGQFVNIKSGRMMPLAVDPEAWKRFGYQAPVKKTRQKKAA